MLQLTELVEGQKVFINRNELQNLKSGITTFDNSAAVREYRNKMAVLSEEVLKSEDAIWSWVFRIRQEAWILGASYYKTMQFNSKNESKCGTDSCYRTSLNEKKNM